MSYNNTNLLRRMVEIQNLTLQYAKKGATQQWIYTNVIYPRFYISKTVYYRYLSVNAKLELKKKEGGKLNIQNSFKADRDDRAGK